VNKRDRDLEVALPQPAISIQYVDLTTKDAPPRSHEIQGTNIGLRGYEVAVVTVQ
jgi:hypothetical protein